MTTAATLAADTRRWLITAAEGLVARFCPDDVVPPVVAGYASFERTDSAFLLLYARLAALGVKELAGKSLVDRIAKQLADLHDAKYATWWCLFIAEALDATSQGKPIDQHPLLNRMSESQRERVIAAIDSSHVVDVPNKKLIGHPNNYWMVMARLELLRKKLGVNIDDEILTLSLHKTIEHFCESKTGYMDDCQHQWGRYDIYTVDALMNAEPIWSHLPADRLRTAIAAHERLILATVNEVGTTVVWGRSAENSNMGALHFACAVLEHHLTERSAAMLGVVAHVLEQFKTRWWADDTVTNHRIGMTHWYRGPFRLVEFGLCSLSTIAAALRQLERAAAVEPQLVADTSTATLFPQQDQFIQFDPRGHGVWCYRQGDLAFQLPVVDGYTSDYVAFPRYPGLFEQPVDKAFACGVPNAFYGKLRFLPLQGPVNVRYAPGELSWETHAFTNYLDFDWWKPREDKKGIRRVKMHVVDGGLAVEETWTFEELPTALAVQWAESEARYEIRDLQCSTPHRLFPVAVEGMQEWRSYFGNLKRVHQMVMTPAKAVTLRYTLRCSDFR